LILKVTGKGRKQRLAPFPIELLEDLEDYLHGRRMKLHGVGMLVVSFGHSFAPGPSEAARTPRAGLSAPG
jgi:hypothetical protein